MADHYQPYPTDYSQQGPSDYGGDQSRGGGRGGRGRTRSRRGRQQDGGDNYGGMRAEFARETGGDTQEGGYGGGGEEYGGRDGGQGRGRGRGRGRGGRRRSASPDYGRGGDEGDRRGRDQWEGDGEYGGRANDRGGRGSREGRRAERERPREESSAFIKDRVKKERPCRTLFLRNIKYETSPDEVREKFERIGEVKTFFDLIPDRGLVFITYYDLRAAMMAKDALQGQEVANRPIDVHYSLPREADLARHCDRDKSQGSLTLSVPDSTSSINAEELRSLFAVHGDLKSIIPHPKEPSDRIIEFFDCRACARAYDALNGKPFAGGTMELHFAWDIAPPLPPPTAPPADFNRGPPPTNPPIRMGFGGPPVIAYPEPPIPSVNERLEQAQKVQQLLSALAGAMAPPPQAVPRQAYAPPQQQGAPPNFYAPPPHLALQPPPHFAPQPSSGGQPDPQQHFGGPQDHYPHYFPPPNSQASFGAPPPPNAYGPPPPNAYSPTPQHQQAYSPSGPPPSNPYSPSRPPTGAYSPSAPLSNLYVPIPPPTFGSPHPLPQQPPLGLSPSLPPALLALLAQHHASQAPPSSAAPAMTPQQQWGQQQPGVGSPAPSQQAYPQRWQPTTSNGQGGQEQQVAQGGQQSTPAQVQALLELLARQSQQGGR